MRRSFFGLGAVLWLSLAYALDTEDLFPTLAAASALHEAGHALAILACGGRIRRLTAAPFGLCLRYDGLLDYRSDALIALGGPAANLSISLLLRAAGLLPRAAGVHLLLGLFQLLPALPLDGGNVLLSLLSLRLDRDAAERAARAVSGLTGAILTGLGVYILAKTRYNMSILAVGSLILGGTYAAGTGKNTAARSKTRPLFRRRIRAGDQG